MKLAGGAVLGPLRQVFGGESVAGLGEGELLERFLSGRDEPSFAALVARLGPMVLGVCRRVLSDPRDVEDAFQATFLVLVRRGATLRDRDRLGPWLFGVARRVATRARSDSARRRSRERPLPGDPFEDPGPDDHRAELALALVEEIDRLPDALRGAVVLCCAEGLSYEQAAAQLRCTAPAIRGRLARARERLRGRLVRRGFAPTAGTLAAWTGAEGTAASVPIPLIEMTTRSALACAAGTTATAGAIPATVATLAEGATRTMILTKWKFLAAGVTTLGVASGVGVLAQQPTPENPGGATTTTTIERPAEPSPSPGRSPFGVDNPSPTPVPMPTPGLTPAPTTPPQAEDSKRLDSLESKLDRVLRALDPAPPMTSQREASRPSRTPPPVEPELPAPPERQHMPPARPRPATRPSPPAPVEEEPELPAPGQRIARAPARTNPGTISSRLDAVERKLGRLEARFAEMERKLGIETGDASNLLPTTPDQPLIRDVPLRSPNYPDINYTIESGVPSIPAPGPVETPDVRPLENYRPRPPR